MAVLDHLLKRTQAQHNCSNPAVEIKRASLGVSSSNSMTSMPLERNQLWSGIGVRCAQAMVRECSQTAHLKRCAGASLRLRSKQPRNVSCVQRMRARAAGRTMTMVGECDTFHRLASCRAQRQTTHIYDARRVNALAMPTSGRSSERETTTRMGAWPPSWRVVRCGLSRLSVLPPTMTASERARSAYTRCRAAGPAQAQQSGVRAVRLRPTPAKVHTRA